MKSMKYSQISRYRTRANKGRGINSKIVLQSYTMVHFTDFPLILQYAIAQN